MSQSLCTIEFHSPGTSPCQVTSRRPFFFFILWVSAQGQLLEMPETALESSCVPSCLLLKVCKLLGDRNLVLAVSQLMGTRLTVIGCSCSWPQAYRWASGRRSLQSPQLWTSPAPPCPHQLSPTPAGGLGDSSICREEEAEWRVICKARRGEPGKSERLSDTPEQHLPGIHYHLKA